MIATDVLTPEMLQRFDERAPLYDRENRFFSEDFEELRESGYLAAPLPADLGGGGMDLTEVSMLQRRLAYHAPATALAVNMHLFWVGMAADLRRMGDPIGDRILERAAAGDVFAAGYGEAGNDVPVLLSSTDATRVDGGWELTGHKIFGSLSPVWDQLGVHAMDTGDPAHPQTVHALLPRSSSGYRIEETWDALGMRATASNDTLLEHTFVPDVQVLLVCPSGFAGAGPFHVASFAWALLGYSSVYAGIAQRTFDEAVACVHRRTSIALTRSMAYHPEVQHEIAKMRIALEGLHAHLDRVCDDWSSGVDHGMEWPLKVVACKYAVVNQAWAIVDAAFDLSGGAGIFKRSRFELLFRDARPGRIHPVNSLLTHELVGKMSLGINPDDQPRWG